MIGKSTLCDDVRAALTEDDFCDITDEGARIATHCLYPSFEPVEVIVSKLSAGYIVSDGGGAVRSALHHGREDIGSTLARECAKFSVEVVDGVIEARVPNAEWLKAAILGVANASASSVAMALAKAHEAAEHDLIEKIYRELIQVLPKDNVARGGLYRGNSGRSRKYDFVASYKRGLLLVNAVTPNHISVASKYVAFSDLPANDAGLEKIAVFDRPLETADATLITTVADLVPVAAIEAGFRRMVG